MSPIVAFQQLSPSIINYGGGQSNNQILYMKSDERFTEEEIVYFSGKNRIPEKCRDIGLETYPDCEFFDITFIEDAIDPRKPNYAGHPPVFNTNGFNNATNLGHLIFKCKNCGFGFVNGAIDLRIFVGPIGGNRRQCLPRHL